MPWKDPFRIGSAIDPQNDAQIAFRMLRDYVETHMRPGELPARLHTGLRATEEAEALIEALRKTSLPYPQIYCRHCDAKRPFTFSMLPAAAEIVCDVCHTPAVAFHIAE